MTRKDYELLARALSGAYPVLEHTTPDSAWRLCVIALATACATDNPRFDANRFYAACGLEVERIELVA